MVIREICLLWKLVSKLSLVEEQIDEGEIQICPLALSEHVMGRGWEGRVTTRMGIYKRAHICFRGAPIKNGLSSEKSIFGY